MNNCLYLARQLFETTDEFLDWLYEPDEELNKECRKVEKAYKAFKSKHNDKE